VLVRKLLGIETSGSINLLFSDKTGTLTKGKLEARYFLAGNNETYQGFSSSTGKAPGNIETGHSRKQLSAVLDTNGEPIGGNTSERALVNFIPVEKRRYFHSRSLHPHVIRFDSSRKFSATEVHGDEYFLRIVQGAYCNAS
jgi:Ca2+-transporting ATPase